MSEPPHNDPSKAYVPGAPLPPPTCTPFTLSAFVLTPALLPYPPSDPLSDPPPLSPNVHLPDFAQPDHSAFTAGPEHLRADCIPEIHLGNEYSNSRLRDPATGEVWEERCGVYLHWTLPREFRGGKAVRGETPTEGGERSLPTAPAEQHRVEYPDVPDRWLVFRYMHTSSPSTPPPSERMSIFLVESNRLRRIHDLSPYLDLPTTTSPFLDSTLPAFQQSHVRLGHSQRFTQDYTPTSRVDPASYVDHLNVLSSGNTLFADYTPHNPGVFSMHDDLTFTDPHTGSLVRPREATMSYLVIGYFNDSILARRSSMSTFESHNTLLHGAVYNVKYSYFKPPKVIQAEDVALVLRGLQALAVGVDTMDAVRTFLAGSTLGGVEPGGGEVGGTGKVGKKDGMTIVEALNGLADVVTDGANFERNSQLPRADTNVENFKPAFGGKRWRMKPRPPGKGKQPVGGAPPHLLEEEDKAGEMDTPDAETAMALKRLNRMQSLLDALGRQERYLRHLIFCEWWKHRGQPSSGAGGGDVGDRIEDEVATRRRNEARRKAEGYWSEVRRIRPVMRGLREGISRECQLGREREKEKEKEKEKDRKEEGKREEQKDGGDIIPFVTEERPRFYSQTDPVLVFGGLGSGWPPNFHKPTKTRPHDILAQKIVQGIRTWISRAHVASRSTQQPVPVTIDQHIGEFAEALGLENAASASNIIAAWTTLMQHKGLEQLFRDRGTKKVVLDLLQEWTLPINPRNMDSETDYPLHPDESLGVDSYSHWDDTQPFLPLFVEWEVEYYHLPASYWQLTFMTDGHLHYRLSRPNDPRPPTENPTIERHLLTGRSLLTPHASHLIPNLLRNLLLKTPKLELDKHLPDSEQETLLTHLRQMSLLSCRLQGFTDHLLTLLQGTHVTPPGPDRLDWRESHGEGDPLRHDYLGLGRFGPGESLFADSDVAHDVAEFLVNDAVEEGGKDTGGMDVTPYGDYPFQKPLRKPSRSLEVDTDAEETKQYFRPVTHGQARLRNLKVVDKFGQVVQVGVEGGDDGIYPWTSPTVACQPVDYPDPAAAPPAAPLLPDVVVEPAGKDSDAQKFKSQFFQLTPRINQDARLRVEFAKLASDAQILDQSVSRGGTATTATNEPYWQPTDPWESPIWGWVVINSSDCGIQIFEADGAFIGEAILPLVTTGHIEKEREEVITWQTESFLRTFQNNDNREGPNNTTHNEFTRLILSKIKHPSLASFVSSLNHTRGLLRTLHDLLARALSSIPATSSGLSSTITTTGRGGGGTLATLVGRPLALVTYSLQLELATPPMGSQAYDDESSRYFAGGMEAPLPPSPALTNYKFGVRMGDPAVEARDGMIALFGFGDNDAKEPAGKVDLRRIYTDYMPKPGPGDSEDIGGGPLKDTRHTHHIHLSPTWPDPLPSSTTSTSSSPSSSPSPPTPTDLANHYFRTLTHPHHTTLYAAIVEPWLPVSISSGILPASRIQIPRNHVRTGIGRLATFIRAGPTLVDGDIAAGVLRTEAPGVLGAWEGVYRGKRGEVEEVDGEWVWVQRVVHDRDRDGKDGRGDEEEEEGESVAYNKYVVKPREPAGVVWGRKTAGEDESEPGRAGFVTAMEGYWWRTGTKDIDGLPAAALKK